MKNIFTLLAILFLAACQPETGQNNGETNKAEEETLVWSDEFESDGKPDPSKWTFQLGDGCPAVCGWGNNELQLYSDDKRNARVEDGRLIIESHLDGNGFSSARLITKNKGDWKTGRIVVRAKLPQGRGTWPAIWMLPSKDKMQWPDDGEIDIMEHVGYNAGTVYGTIHTEKYNHILGTQKIDSIQVEDSGNAFHDYTLIWTEDQMRWLVDDKVYHQIKRNGEDKDGWPFNAPFHLILNLAVGGNWGGKYGVDSTAFPQQLEVDYVRIYQ